MRYAPARRAASRPEPAREALLAVPAERLRADHLRRATRLMAETGVACLVGLGGGGLGERAIVRFLANHSTTGRQSAAVLFADGRLVLLVVYSAHYAWALQSSWADEVRLVPALEGAVCDFLRDELGAGQAVGVAGPSLATASLLSSGARLAAGLRFTNLSPETERVVVRKSDLDLRLAADSGHLAEAALTATIELLAPGISEREVFANLEREVRRHGAESSSILVATDGSVASGVPKRRTLERGDLVQMSVEVAAPGGYWVQAVRTIPVDGDETHVELLARASEAEHLIVDQLGVGRDPMGIELPDGLLPGNLRPAVPFWHGIGLSLGEPPGQDDETSHSLEAGTVIAIHPNFYGDGLGVFVGNTYCIETTGARSLTSSLPAKPER